MVLPQGILLCQTFQILFAGNPYAVSLLPRGSCHLCCEINPEEDIIFTTHFRTGESLRAGVSAGAPGLDVNKPTVVYIHGFTEQGTSPSASTVRQAYFVGGHDVNFVTVDWARLSAFPWYAAAVDNVPQAAVYLARFLERLVQDGVDPSDIHLVGFSLGAEVAGFAGKSVNGFRLGRITGLDPAFPLFRWTDRNGHLSREDADYVDVIHTDGGEWGVMAPIGHADFYPNGGGPMQPGCRMAELRRMGQFPQEFIGCSHTRAWIYYAESILSPGSFVALRCRSAAAFRSGECEREAAVNATASAPGLRTPGHGALAFMGVDAPRWCRGSYFLDTSDRFPFARGLNFRYIR